VSGFLCACSFLSLRIPVDRPRKPLFLRMASGIPKRQWQHAALCIFFLAGAGCASNRHTKTIPPPFTTFTAPQGDALTTDEIDLAETLCLGGSHDYGRISL